jgi:hypothetical protein
MSLDETHPHVVRDEGRLVLTPDPVAFAADLEAERLWRRRAARAGVVSLPVGGILGLAAGIVVGTRIGGVTAITACLLIGPILGFVLGTTFAWPRPAGPRPRATATSEELHPFLVAHAPGGAPYSVLHAWQAVCQEYEAARGYLAKGRVDATLSEEERTVAIGERTKWYYSPQDLPGLEGRYAAARDDLVVLARELGVDPPAETD